MNYDDRDEVIDFLRELRKRAWIEGDGPDLREVFYRLSYTEQNTGAKHDSKHWNDPKN